MTDHTPAEIAAAHRVLADDEDRRWDKLGFSGPAPMAEWHRKEADELDPPKPTWPEGTYAAVTCANDFVTRSYFAKRVDGEWVTADGRGVCDDQDVTKVEPLRVLGDDEIALSRDLFHGMTAAESRHKGSLFLDNCDVQRIFYAYADALDAEAGDAK